LFIDESGDPGYNDGTRTNTLYYTELALQISPQDIKPLVRHIVNWKYCHYILSERKQLPKDEKLINRYLIPVKELAQEDGIKCSAVYIYKPKYTGPYLKDTLTTKDEAIKLSIKFRNFVHKQLLEHHFKIYPKTDHDYLIAIFDYYRMSKTAFRNVHFYLQEICGFPLDEICHFDSNCSWGLEITGQLANIVSDMQLDYKESVANMTDFISLKDITRI